MAKFFNPKVFFILAAVALTAEALFGHKDDDGSTKENDGVTGLVDSAVSGGLGGVSEVGAKIGAGIGGNLGLGGGLLGGKIGGGLGGVTSGLGGLTGGTEGLLGGKIGGGLGGVTSGLGGLTGGTDGLLGGKIGGGHGGLLGDKTGSDTNSGTHGGNKGCCSCDDSLKEFLYKFGLVLRAYGSKELGPQANKMIGNLRDFTLSYLAKEKPEEMAKLNGFLETSAKATGGALVQAASSSVSAAKGKA